MNYTADKVPITTLTIKVSTHELVKLFASRKQMSMQQAAEYLLQKILRQEYGSMH